jgi:hypothetical protein
MNTVNIARELCQLALGLWSRRDAASEEVSGEQSQNNTTTSDSQPWSDTPGFFIII